MQQRRNATARVPAGSDLRAIGVQNAHEHVGGARWLQQDDLIAARSGGSVGDRTCHCCGQPNRLGASVNHDEVVAEAIHFHKRNTPQVHVSAARCVRLSVAGWRYIDGGSGLCKVRCRFFNA